MPNIKKYSSEEQIERYYTGEGTLSEKDQEVAERWELAFALLQKHRLKKVAVKKYIAIQARKNNKISQAQAYRDMSMAEKVFVPINKTSKEFQRQFLIEQAMKDLKRIENRLRGTVNDEGKREPLSDRALIDLLGVKNKIEWRLIELTGISDDMADMPDFSKLEPSHFTINIAPEQQEMLKKILQNGVTDVTKLMKEFRGKVEDVDHEDVNE